MGGVKWHEGGKVYKILSLKKLSQSRRAKGTVTLEAASWFQMPGAGPRESLAEGGLSSLTHSSLHSTVPRNLFSTLVLWVFLHRIWKKEKWENRKIRKLTCFPKAIHVCAHYVSYVINVFSYVCSNTQSYRATESGPVNRCALHLTELAANWNPG